MAPNEKAPAQAYYAGAGLALGAGGGVVVGALVGGWALGVGIAVGAGVGLVIGAAIDARRGRRPSK